VADLGALEHTIRLFDLDTQLGRAKPVPGEHAAFKGEMRRDVVAALRAEAVGQGLGGRSPAGLEVGLERRRRLFGRRTHRSSAKPSTDSQVHSDTKARLAGGGGPPSASRRASPPGGYLLPGAAMD
jgi:hypothetical protein